MVPPRSMTFVGVGDFVAIGREFREYFIDLGGLGPDEKVLDVGCGIGRMAVPLTEYLSAEGGYWGFDVVKSGIDWCNANIAPKFPNFRFQHSDVHNRHYNAAGSLAAREYRFPFPDRFFDFVFVTSVFTHMLPPELERYVSEIGRVLRPGGRCLATFFLLNSESRALLGEGRSRLEFRFAPAPQCLSISEDDPEAAIAYDEDYVRRVFAGSGLRIRQPAHYGGWCERQPYLSHQDILVADRDPA
jgi:SAM-dependent methyltransferase